MTALRGPDEYHVYLAASDSAYEVKIHGESYPRYKLTANGAVALGTGDAAPATVLSNLGGFVPYGIGPTLKRQSIAIAATGVATEVDTGTDLPSQVVIERAMLEITAAEETSGTATIDIGLHSTETGGDADGFMVGADVSATGWVADPDAGLIGNATTGTAVSVSFTLGDANFADLAGTLYIDYWE